MVRTRADNCGKKAVASKAPRKAFSSGSGNGSHSSLYGNSSARNCSGAPLVNHAHMWPTPKWQKGIKSFFNKKEFDNQAGSSASSSGPSSPANDKMDVIVQNALSLEVTDDADRLLPIHSSKIIPDTLDDNDSSSSPEDTNKTLSTSKKKDDKTKVGPATTYRKRRVVIAESSDEDE